MPFGRRPPILSRNHRFSSRDHPAPGESTPAVVHHPGYRFHETTGTGGTEIRRSGRFGRDETAGSDGPTVISPGECTHPGGVLLGPPHRGRFHLFLGPSLGRFARPDRSWD